MMAFSIYKGGLIILPFLVISFILYLWVKGDEHKINFPLMPYTIHSEATLKTYKLYEPIFNIRISHQLNSAPCDNNIRTIILVTSYVGNIETRSAMRRSFSNHELGLKFNIKRVFLLAVESHNQQIKQEAIENESFRFNDLIQGNFFESYRNLTYKHMMGLQWAVNYCPNVQYIVKMDDDIVIDVENVVILLNNTKFPRKKLLAGYRFKNMAPKRVSANKWYVTQDEYKYSTYPTFLSGWFYVTNPFTANLLLHASKTQSFFWIDDVLVTGILAVIAHITHIPLDNIYSVHSEFMQCCLADLLKSNLDCPFLIGPNGGDNNLFYSFNKAIANCRKNSKQFKCSPRTISINETCIVVKKSSIGQSIESIIKPIKL